MDGYEIGTPVRMTWCGGIRDGIVIAPTQSDKLSTGATFVPVCWDDDGTVSNVDSRVLRALGISKSSR